MIKEFSFSWQKEKRLSSGQCVAIVTGIYVYWDQYVPQGPYQRWFRVGMYDYDTGSIGYLRFSNDDVVALLRAGVSVAPWSAAPALHIQYGRRSSTSASGRFAVRAELILTDTLETARLDAAREVFREDGHLSNAAAGVWNREQERATRERAIEAAVESKSGWFQRWEIVEATGYAGYQVGAILQTLRREGRLHCEGRGRGARYRWSDPAVIERLDWVS